MSESALPAESVLPAELLALDDRIARCSARAQPALQAQLQRLLLRARRGLPADRDQEKLLADLDKAERWRQRRETGVPTRQYDEALPVVQARSEIAAAIAAHQVVVIAGETGSGKTTQIPKICLDLGLGLRGLIGHTQPRRLAATSVARRIADELGTTLGTAVGYNIRFDQKSSDDTLIEVMTDGVLLQALRRDPLLRRYDTLIIDEAHERSLNIDLLLGYLKRILPQRPDLKLIITSATIDPEKFARFFADAGGNPAPMLSISGRTFPVETRYQPLQAQEDEYDDRSVPEAVHHAAQELWREGPGDVLVFLSGEGEIRDVAQYLRRHPLPRAEVMPLYARLSAAEQNKVFTASNGRRIVLATNVAETSLTVPGIRYVVDSGTARISRYSQASRVQRLPIEAIARASADQRKGRCGRVASGICVRLYSEDDFLARPEFTTPEIQRTNLASLLLQMLSLGITEIETFPFVDAPDQKRINDGLRLLQELGAIDEARKLTASGRKMAEFPLPPQLSRLLIAAEKERCLREALIIASFLCIRDPRERPMEKSEAANALHKRFIEAGSDYLSILKLWEHIHQRKEALSSSAWRKELKAEFLNVLAVIEWGRLYAQLRQIAVEQQLRSNEHPADALSLHRAVLAGFIHQIGQRTREGDWLGPRNVRFVAHNSSALHKQAAPWVVAADFLDGTRLYGMQMAAIDARDIERLGGDLLKRSYTDPHWRRDRGDAAIKEQITIFGLLLVPARPVALAKINPQQARELFIRHALVQFDSDEKAEFLAHNKRVIARVQEREARQRRRDLLVSEDSLLTWFDARLPPSVVDWHSLQRLLKTDAALGKLLMLSEADVTQAMAAGDDAWPAEWPHDDGALRLKYSFAPGEEHDGVSVELPLARLPGLDAGEFEWLVPGHLESKVEALLRNLPKDTRKQLHPLADYAKAISSKLIWREGDFHDALARVLFDCARLRVSASEWRELEQQVPAHLRMRFMVLDERKRVLAQGRDLAALQQDLARTHRASVSAKLKTIEQDGLQDWPEMALPERAKLAGGEAFLALVAKDDGIAVRGFVREEEARWQMRAGVRELVRKALEADLKSFVRQQRDVQQLQLAAAAFVAAPALLADWGRAAVEAVLPADVWNVRSRDSGRQLIADLAKPVRVQLADSLPVLKALMQTAAEVKQMCKLIGLPALRADIEVQLARWLAAGCISQHGLSRLRHLRRYMDALKQRAERARVNGGAELQKLAVWQQWLGKTAPALTGAAPWSARGEQERELRRLLDEFHVSLFAQSLGTDGPVSEKRIEKLLETMR